MRLVKALLALMLATSMTMFPIAIQKAAASVGHHQAGVVPHSHHGAATATMVCEDGSSNGAVAADTCTHSHDHASSHKDGGSVCCGSVALHGFGISAAPNLSVPVAYGVKRACFRDEQTARIFSVRLDRPPRTV